MRRTILWLGGILFIVLQVDYWIAPWNSNLQMTALWVSTFFGLACLADGLFQARAPIRRWVSRLRRL